MTIRSFFAAACATLLTLVLAPIAGAKGPSEAKIEGPGLSKALVLKGDGEGPGSPLGAVMELELDGRADDHAGRENPRYRICGAHQRAC